MTASPCADVVPTDSECRVAVAASALPGVHAVSLGGSRAAGLADEGSDSDLYCWTGAQGPDPRERAGALGEVADDGVRADDTWGPCDHVYVGGHHVEVMYFDLEAILADHRRASEEGQHVEAFFGALMHTVITSVPLVDDHGTLAAAREQLAVYPEATRMLLRQWLPVAMGEYLHQISQAQRREDWPMVLHKHAAAQAVHVNLLFALNRVYHPGEKRLLTHAASLPLQPRDHCARFAAQARLGPDDPALVPELTQLWQELCALGD